MFYTANRDGFKEIVPGVMLKTLVHGERTHFTEVHLLKGAVIPMHQHPQEQTGYMVSGILRFTVNGEGFTVKPGDSWNLPANTPHAAVAVEKAVVIEVFAPAREDYLALSRTMSDK